MAELYVLCVFCLLTQASGQVSQIGNNLIQNGSTYYTVITCSDSDYLCLMSSQDLFDWSRVRGIFDEFSAPLWAPSTFYRDPEIVMLDEENVRVYFSAEDRSSTTMAVGVAFSTKIEADRRYSTLNRPIAFSGTSSYVSPSLVPASSNASVQLPLLLFVASEEKAVFGALLTKDGLQLEESPVRLVNSTLAWEGGNITAAWGLTRFGLYYVFYSAAEQGVGVARSQFPLGPYTKQKEPFARITNTPLAKSTLMKNIRWEKGWPQIRD